MSAILPPPLATTGVVSCIGVAAEFAPHFTSLEEASAAGWEPITINIDLHSLTERTYAISIKRDLEGAGGHRPVPYAICWAKGKKANCTLLRHVTQVAHTK